MVMENKLETNNGVERPENEINSPGPEKETLIREIESGKSAIAELKQGLVSKDTEVTALNQSLAKANNALDARGKSLSQAIAAYRELVVQANPGVLAEMITGGSIEDVNASLESARSLTEKVRRGIEAEAARTRIPAGAPPRTPPDMSALSAREKIQYALGGG
jgi:predicted RNase H-like nuclease (RuvC/YqgF family)